MVFLSPLRIARRAVTERFLSIKVIERPGADYPAPPHTEGTGECWCEPTVLIDDEGLYALHNEFEN
jgi:hypothetical protein